MRMLPARIHRRVIGRGEPGLLLAVLAVDLDRAHALEHRARREQQIDPQPLALVERAAAVVPPRERLHVGMALAEHVEEPDGEQRAEPRALVLAVEDPAGVPRLVPAVERARTDVEVAA